MPFRLPIEPDAMPIREALRAVRHLVRRSGRTVRETVGPGLLPPPAEAVADTLIRDAREAARGMETVVSDFARSVIGARGGPEVTLGALERTPEAEARFAAAAYAMLKHGLRRLGANPPPFVSEAAARRAYADVAAAPMPASAAEAAARLTIALLDARVVRGVGPEGAGKLKAGAVEAVAVVALSLCLLSTRTAEESEAALEAAIDLAVVLAEDALSAIRSVDVTRLAAFYARYASHV